MKKSNKDFFFFHALVNKSTAAVLEDLFFFNQIMLEQKWYSQYQDFIQLNYIVFYFLGMENTYKPACQFCY